MSEVVVFTLDEQRYGLPVERVERVVRAAEITPLPLAPQTVLGAVTLQGEVVPVLNVRHCVRHPECEIDPDDQFIVAHTARRKVVLAVDEAVEVLVYSREEMMPVSRSPEGVECLSGVVKGQDGMILMLDLDRFLSSDEEQVLDSVMKP